MIGKATSPVTVVPAEASLILEKVLLATDGSVYSQKASLWAIGFCQKLGNILLVLSVAKTENGVSFAEECVKSAEEKAKNQGVKTESLILKGEPFEKILETSSQKGIDLIVMGCKGKTGIEKILMGSLTERVIEDSKASVVVLK
uniref:Universal stress protein n=1 Tax=Thermodesulfobacterium geofontis TaxID=1295609 RepID=A0A7V5XH52_9BACT